MRSADFHGTSKTRYDDLHTFGSGALDQPVREKSWLLSTAPAAGQRMYKPSIKARQRSNASSHTSLFQNRLATETHVIQEWRFYHTLALIETDQAPETG